MPIHETDRVKVDDHTWRVQCVSCGEYFEASRYDASFCTPRCRVSFSREDGRRQALIQQIDSWGKSLERTAKKYRYNKEVFAAMIQLQRDIKFALSLFENE